MNDQTQYVRFDWAAKRMLRDKANYAVLEGLMTVLIGEEMKIVELLESESNQESVDDKFNRVDIMARDSKGDIVLVEIQQTRELYFLQRLLFSVAKTVTDYMSLGDRYDKVKKVYSISILYFDLGQGADYLYHGHTVFEGVHTHDTLKISSKEQEQIVMVTPDNVFPEYYLIRVNEFNQVAKTPLEEWIEYLKTGFIKSDTRTPGLDVARERLRYMQMNDSERMAYNHHLETIRYQNSVFDAAHLEGRAEGEKSARIANARAMKADGMPEALIAKYSGLDQSEIAGL